MRSAGRLVPGFDANIWWIDLRSLPAWAQLGAMLLMVWAAAWAVLPAWFARRRWARNALSLYLLALAGLCAMNAAVFYRLLAEGDIRSRMPVPFSILMAAMLLGVLAAVRVFAPPEVEAAGRGRGASVWRFHS